VETNITDEKLVGHLKPRTRCPQEVLDILNREDYYKILKINKNPKDSVSIRWNVMRSKFAALYQSGYL